MTSRALLSVLLLLGSTGAYAKESAPGGDAGGGNAQQQQCSDVDNAMEAAGGATPAKPRVVKAPAAPVRPKPISKPLPTARGDSDVDSARLPTPRWDSFLPGMFR